MDKVFKNIQKHNIASNGLRVIQIMLKIIGVIYWRLRLAKVLTLKQMIGMKNLKKKTLYFNFKA